VFDSGHCGDVQDKRGNLAVAVARVLRQAKEPVPEFQELPSDSSSMPANLEWAPTTAVIKASDLLAALHASALAILQKPVLRRILWTT